MQFERLTLSGDPAARAEELASLVPAPESVRDEVAEIIARVRANGDDALRYYTRQFDTGGSTPSALMVPDAELDTAAERLDDDGGDLVSSTREPLRDQPQSFDLRGSTRDRHATDQFGQQAADRLDIVILDREVEVVGQVVD